MFISHSNLVSTSLPSRRGVVDLAVACMPQGATVVWDGEVEDDAKITW
jgi:hypothetical protein